MRTQTHKETAFYLDVSHVNFPLDFCFLLPHFLVPIEVFFKGYFCFIFSVGKKTISAVV